MVVLLVEAHRLATPGPVLQDQAQRCHTQSAFAIKF